MINKEELKDVINFLDLTSDDFTSLRRSFPIESQADIFIEILEDQFGIHSDLELVEAVEEDDSILDYALSILSDRTY